MLAAGCATFTPVVPMGARSGDVELRLRHVRASPRSALLFDTRSEKAHALRRGWLTVATRDPCTGGAEVGGITIDGGSATGGVLPAGSHELVVKVSDMEGSELDLVLDLEVDEGACVRAPAYSQVVPIEPDKRVVVVTGFGLGGNQDVAGLRSAYGVYAGAGRWFGPALLTAQVGVGESLCNESTCGKDSDGNLRSGFIIPFSVDARYAFSAIVRNRIVGVPMLGARYSFTPVRLPTFDGERRFGAHSAQAVLAWGMSDNMPAPVRNFERAVPIEFAFPIGVLVAPNAPGRHLAFAAGFEMRVFFFL